MFWGLAVLSPYIPLFQIDWHPEWLVSSCHISLLVWYRVCFEYVHVCCAYVGISFAVNIEADSNDITDDSHGDISRPYLCTVCDKWFTNRNYWRSHMNVHSGKYKCTECEKCFGSNTVLKRHKQTHSGEKPFECTVCSKQFTRSSNLDVHSRTHSGQKPYKCLECDKTFSRSGSLNRHMRFHTGDKLYKCSLCNISFTTSSHLQSHKHTVHSNRRPYDCRYCGKLFKNSRNLKCHVRTHTGAQPYSCRHCSERFMWPIQLQTHMLKSHNDGTWFTCYICQQKFTQSGNLKVHIRRHEGVKPYVCNECPKSFRGATELKHHYLRHLNIWLFCCCSGGKFLKHEETVIKHRDRSCSCCLVIIFSKLWETNKKISVKCQQKWHVLHKLLPAQSTHDYYLRPRSHDRLLCVRTDNKNFLSRMLFKDSYFS